LEVPSKDHYTTIGTHHSSQRRNVEITKEATGETLENPNTKKKIHNT